MKKPEIKARHFGKLKEALDREFGNFMQGEEI